MDSEVEHQLNVARSKAGYLAALTRRGPSGSHYQERIAWAARDLSDYLNAWGQQYSRDARARTESRPTGETGCL